MKRFLKRIAVIIWLQSIYMNIIKRFKFRKAFCNFKAQNLTTKSRFKVQWSDRYPCLNDKTAAPSFDRHYVFHTAWAARILADIRPEYHVDISSSLYFCSIVSAFVPVRFYDYRPTDLRLDNLASGAADLLNLPFPNDSVRSMSCMHVVEHVGLGRYGDPLDPDGDLKAIAELTRSLSPGGNLLFVVPVGKQKLAFNAHRIYMAEEVISYFPSLELLEFALIPDNPNVGGLLRKANPSLANEQTYGCGCFWFNRPYCR